MNAGLSSRGVLKSSLPELLGSMLFEAASSPLGGRQQVWWLFDQSTQAARTSPKVEMAAQKLVPGTLVNFRLKLAQPQLIYFEPFPNVTNRGSFVTPAFSAEHGPCPHGTGPCRDSLCFFFKRVQGLIPDTGPGQDG